MHREVPREVHDHICGNNVYPEVSQRLEDTQAVANFLLALKHRTETPEPVPRPVQSDGHIEESRTPFKPLPSTPYEDSKTTFNTYPDLDMDWETLLDNSKLVK